MVLSCVVVVCGCCSSLWFVIVRCWLLVAIVVCRVCGCGNRGLLCLVVVDCCFVLLLMFCCWLLLCFGCLLCVGCFLLLCVAV